MILRRAILMAILTFVIIGATDTTAQGGPFNYGRRWSSWSPLNRSIYLEGFRDGQSHAYFALVDDLPPGRREPLRLMTFTLYDADALGNVITSLYTDPANAYIQNDDMVYIARDKLSGIDVDPELRTARSRGSLPR